MGAEKEKRIVGTISVDDALKKFAKFSSENESILKRVEKINEIVDTIVAERHLLGWSQRDLSEKTGIKQPMIARFEKLEMFPRIDTLIKITDALNLSVKITYPNQGDFELLDILDMKEAIDYNGTENSFDLLNGGCNFYGTTRKNQIINNA